MVGLGGEDSTGIGLARGSGKVGQGDATLTHVDKCKGWWQQVGRGHVAMKKCHPLREGKVKIKRKDLETQCDTLHRLTR